MKTSVTILILAVVIYAFGQSYGGLGFAPIAPAIANCPAGVPNGAMICAVGTAAPYTLYVSYNAGAYAPLVGASGGVSSYNGRTGNVLPAVGDYNYSDLKNPPTKLSCSTASHSNTGLTASGCTITP